MAPLINPPLTAASPLGSLSGWRFVLHCRQCGERYLNVTRLTGERKEKFLAIDASTYATPLGEIVGRFKCSGCGLRPERLEAECVWASMYISSKTRIDLSALLPH